MTRARLTLPLLARLLLRLCRLGDRRADVKSDMLELIEKRRASHGRAHAWRRSIADAFSVWLRPPARTFRLPATSRTRSRWYADVPTDVVFATRVFRRQAGVVSMGVLGLAVAIGLTTTVFSVANTNFKPLGVPEPDRVFKVLRTVGPSKVAYGPLPFAEFLTLQASARSARLEGSVGSRLAVSDAPVDETGATAVARFVTDHFFSTLGGHAVIGRIPGSDDGAAGAAPVAVLSHAFWRTRFNGDRSIVGKTIYLGGKAVTVIGVLAQSFTGPFETRNTIAVWLPLSAAASLDPYAGPFSGTSSAPIDVVGRLGASFSVAQTEGELATLAAGLQQGPTPAQAIGLIVTDVKRQLDTDDFLMLALVLSLVGLVVLLASTNVANVLLASATMRQGEIGARLALGASRSRIVRQLLTESLLLGAVAGALGLLLTSWMSKLAVAMTLFPGGLDIAPDGRVYLFVTGVSILAGVLSGLAPALHGARGRLCDALKASSSQAGAGMQGSRARSVFLGVQAAASAILLVLTALFTRSMMDVADREPGFDPDTLVAVNAFAPRSGSKMPDAEFFAAALERLRAIRGVKAVALTDHPPFDQSFRPIAATLNGDRYRLIRTEATPNYFDAVGFRLLQGRLYTDDEMAARAPVAVITAGLARDYWPEGDAVGSSLERVVGGYKEIQVVGVVTDSVPHLGSPGYSGAQAIYLPLSRRTAPQIVVVGSSAAAMPLRAVKDAVAALDSGRPVTARLIRDDMQRATQWPRTFASMGAIVGGVALLLAVIGVFGVTAFVVQTRRREIGIRLAIGASRLDVVLTMYRQGMKPVVIGLAVGLGLALLGSQVFSWALYADTSPRDPLSFVAAAVVLLLATGAGVFIPARRAARVDPALSLRAE